MLKFLTSSSYKVVPHLRKGWQTKFWVHCTNIYKTSIPKAGVLVGLVKGNVLSELLTQVSSPTARYCRPGGCMAVTALSGHLTVLVRMSQCQSSSQFTRRSSMFRPSSLLWLLYMSKSLLDNSFRSITMLRRVPLLRYNAPFQKTTHGGIVCPGRDISALLVKLQIPLLHNIHW